MNKLNGFQVRCQDCINLVEKNGIWCCYECFEHPIEEIDDCPEGITLEQVEEINAKKIKVKLNAGNHDKKQTKPRTVKISDEKRELFTNILNFLQESYPNCTEIIKENKLLLVKLSNGKEIKVDLIETRAKKK